MIKLIQLEKLFEILYKNKKMIDKNSLYYFTWVNVYLLGLMSECCGWQTMGPDWNRTWCWCEFSSREQHWIDSVEFFWNWKFIMIWNFEALKRKRCQNFLDSNTFDNLVTYFKHQSYISMELLNEKPKNYTEEMRKNFAYTFWKWMLCMMFFSVAVTSITATHRKDEWI